MKKTRKTKKYGWIPDLPDHRDHIYAAPHLDASTLPPLVDLAPQCPPVVDQGQLGSCTGNGIGGVHYFDQLKQNKANAFQPSRLFIYYNERVIEGTVRQDAGAQIRDGIKSIAAQGVCPESLWPYDVKQFTKKPSDACYTEAMKHQAVKYQRVPQNLLSIKSCLASGFPIVFGFTVYESFESNTVAKTGIMPMPGRHEQVLGGHCVYCIGYDDSKQLFKCRNSWGTGWGDHGDFYMPYAYMTNPHLADDFWQVTTVEA